MPRMRPPRRVWSRPPPSPSQRSRLSSSSAFAFRSAIDFSRRSSYSAAASPPIRATSREVSSTGMPSASLAPVSSIAPFGSLRLASLGVIRSLLPSTRVSYPLLTVSAPVRRQPRGCVMRRREELPLKRAKRELLGRGTVKLFALSLDLGGKGGHEARPQALQATLAGYSERSSTGGWYGGTRRRSMRATYCYVSCSVPSPPLGLPTFALIRAVLFASSPSRWPAGRFPISERLRRRLHGPSGPLRPYPPGFAGVLSPSPPPRSPLPCPHERRFACAPRRGAGHGCSNTFALRLLCARIVRNPCKYANI